MTKHIYRALFIDVSSRNNWIEDYPLKEITGPVDLGVKLHLEKYNSWNKPVYHPDNVVVIGAGPLAGTRLYGTHRFIAVFRSPMTYGLHVSAMGGAAYQFNIGVDAIVVSGRSDKPLVIEISDVGDGKPLLDYIEIQFDKLINTWRDYKGLKGTYALQQYLVDERRDFFERYNARCILVGPGSYYTNTGALVSFTLIKGKIDYGSEDFAARAGGGSVLLKAHNVVAIVYGGLYNRAREQPSDLTDIASINKLYTELTGKPYTQIVIEAGVKYRFDSKLNTGGTLGGNYPHLGVTTPMLHWNIVNMDKETRQRLHNLIMKNIWEPFNKEAIETKSWKTCGEPCPLACKKVRKGKYKSDYEPYNGLGPFIGVFDIHEAEKIVELADAYGIDAIELGYIIGFVFEAISRGLLKPDDVGLSRVPIMDPAKMGQDASAINAKLAVELVEKLAFGLNPILRLIGERGLRDAAGVLDIMYEDRVRLVGTRFSDLLVYSVFGDRGHISPNYYWTPGLVAPLYVLGKYWTVYTGVFMEPEDFAAKALERAYYELMIENAGICRFHRGWAEKTIPVILERYYGIDNPIKRAEEIYKKIARYQRLAGARPKMWDSKRLIEFIAKASEEYGNTKWAELFRKDPVKTAEEWWNIFYNKVESILSQ